MSRWHEVGVSSAQSHPLYGRGGWLAFWFAYLMFLGFGILVFIFFVLAALPEIPGDLTLVILLDILFHAVLIVYLGHTVYSGLQKIPTPEGGVRFDAGFPRKVVIFVALTILVQAFDAVFVPGGPALGNAIAFASTILNAVVLILYFEFSRRVRVTYRHELVGGDPLLSPA